MSNGGFNGLHQQLVDGLIAGGAGTVLGTIVGALFLGIIKNALPVIDVSPFWQMAISGTAIIVAVTLNNRNAKGKGRIILRRAQEQTTEGATA